MKNIFIKMLDMVLPIVLPLIISNAKVMKQKAITTDQIKFNEAKKSLYVNYGEFVNVLLKMIICRQKSEEMEGAGCEAAEAEISVVGSDLYNYWAKNDVTPQQAFNIFFK